MNFRYQSSGQTLRWPLHVGERVLEILPDAGIVVDVSDAVVAILAAGGRHRHFAHIYRCPLCAARGIGASARVVYVERQVRYHRAVAGESARESERQSFYRISGEGISDAGPLGCFD